jgi:hypothetical protein
MQILICSSYVVIQFAQSRPISSNWETVPGAVCWAVDPVIKYGWTVAGMLAVNPVEGWWLTQIVRAVYLDGCYPVAHANPLSPSLTQQYIGEDSDRRPHGVGTLRHRHQLREDDHIFQVGEGDVMQATIMPSLWAKLEEQVGLIATSLPCLKGPVELPLEKDGCPEGA